MDGVAYTVSKFMGERLCQAAASASEGRLTAVALRIGWCQPGANRPETINASGVPGVPAVSGLDAERDLRWFRNMWLSDRDFGQAAERALVADPALWPSVGIAVNAMSANAGMAWSLEGARSLLGYVPQDDLWRELDATSLDGAVTAHARGLSTGEPATVRLRSDPKPSQRSS